MIGLYAFPKILRAQAPSGGGQSGVAVGQSLTRDLPTGNVARRQFVVVSAT